MGRKIVILFISVIAIISCINGKTFLFIGDSITDGNWGSPNKYPCSTEERNLYDENHLLGHGYVEMTSGYFMGEYPNSGYKFINRGISGETLSQIASRWNSDVIKHNPDVISLLCGTNDIHYWLEGNPASVEEFDFEAYGNCLDSLVTLTKNFNPESIIFLCTPFVGEAGWAGKAANYPLREEGVDSIAEITRYVAERHKKENVYLVDFHSLKGTLEEENPDIGYWIWDGIHPSTAMHHRMSRQWIDTYRRHTQM